MSGNPKSKHRQPIPNFPSCCLHHMHLICIIRIICTIADIMLGVISFVNCILSSWDTIKATCVLLSELTGWCLVYIFFLECELFIKLPIKYKQTLLMLLSKFVAYFELENNCPLLFLISYQSLFEASRCHLQTCFCPTTWQSRWHSVISLSQKNALIWKYEFWEGQFGIH